MNLYTPKTKGYYIYKHKLHFFAQRYYQGTRQGKTFYTYEEAYEWLKGLGVATSVAVPLME